MKDWLKNMHQVSLLYEELYRVPVNDIQLFEKARIFNHYGVNLGLDYRFFMDGVKVECSELFTNILMRDLLSFSELHADTFNHQLVRCFLLNVLKIRKSGFIWRFVSDDIKIRVEFLMTLDTRRCPIVRKYFNQMFVRCVKDTLVEKKD